MYVFEGGGGGAGGYCKKCWSVVNQLAGRSGGTKLILPVIPFLPK